MKLRSILFRLSIAVVLLSFVTSCRFDSILIASSTTENEIVLFIPATESVEVRSTPTSSECYIYNAAVLIVENNAVKEAEYITSIGDNGTQSPSLRLTSLTPSSSDNIVVVCNFDTDVTASAVAGLEGEALTTAQSTLQGKAAYSTTDNETTASLETPLLMYGSGTYGNTISLTFQVAKITVEIEEGSTAASSDLDIKSFFTYGSAPNTTWGGSGQTSDGEHKMSATSGESMYVYENTSSSTTLSQSSGNYIILEVTNPASDVDNGVSVAEGSTGYICLAYGETGSDYFERGRHYNFKINNLYSRGYDTVEEAIKNPGNVGYEVIITDDWSTDYQYNGQYAIATAVDTAYIQFTTSSATDLVQIGTYLASSAQNNITTRTASLVRIDGNTFTAVTQASSGIILTDNKGNSATANNVLTIPASIDDDYTLQYTTSGEIVEGMYLRIRYGNLEKFITVPTVSFSYSDIGEVSTSGASIELSVTKSVWNPGERSATSETYSDFTITVPEGVDWVTVRDGKIIVVSAHGIEWGATVIDGDLSKLNGFNTSSQSTANCYIVNAPGSYNFPVVYGNAIKDGSDNTEAYTKKDGTDTHNFVDANGNQISKTYIIDQNTGLTDAILLWEDVDGMINKISLASDKKTLSFEVDSTKISEGNAVIAVRNSSQQILWSWHIWVTTYNPYEEYTTIYEWKNGNTFHAMNHYLGNCSSLDIDPRSTELQVSADDIDVPGFTLSVSQGAVEQIGDLCYYQCGRKDPFPGLHRNNANVEVGSGNAYASGNFYNKQTYGTIQWSPSTSDAEDVSGNSLIQTYTSKSDEVRYPGYLNNGDATTGSTLRGPNYWNAANTGRYSDLDNSLTSEVVVKTVYDPCPPDFCVPPIGFFTAFFPTNTDFTNQNSGGSYITMNIDSAYATSEELLINLQSGSNPETYTLMVVPFRDVATNNGSVRTNVSFSIFSSTPHASSGSNNTNASLYQCLAILGHYSDYRDAHLNNANLVPQARSVLPVREPNPSNTSLWTY